MVKNPPAMRRPGFDSWVGKIPWRREWLPTPVFWPGEQSMPWTEEPGRLQSMGSHWVSPSSSPLLAHFRHFVGRKSNSDQILCQCC